MSFEAIDVITQMTETILEQYKESPNLLAYMKVLLEPFQELEDTFTDILNKRLVDNAVQAQLDVNGELVVLPRGVYDSATVHFFGLNADDINAPVFHKGLGDVNDPTVGGFFRSLEQPVADRTYIDDGSYRRSILGKAKKNGFKGGVENLLKVLTGIIPLNTGESIEIKEDFTTPSDPFVLITFHKVLNAIQKSLLTFYDIVPRGGGIRFEYADSNGQFT